ncbi:cytochrome P450 [Daedaleopsis nitida]|nr:cytochrome P450 [Daedaleopsis nitida]
MPATVAEFSCQSPTFVPPGILLDSIVGPDRMPDFDDLDTIAPLAIPHATTADLEFRGYFVLTGTILVANVWACMHDAQAYDDPEELRPERFIRDGRLNPDVRSPASFVFGVGRRICPGRYFALVGLFINMTSALHVFNITPPLDEAGEPLTIAPEMANGLISHPEECRCTIKPRSSRAAALRVEHARLARADVGGV